jgi:hypothetical protein
MIRKCKIFSRVVQYGDQTINQSLATSSSPNSVYIYIHVYVHSQEPLRATVVLDKLLNSLRYYGLMQIASQIFLCVYGPSAMIHELLQFYQAKFTVLEKTSEFDSYFEFPSLTILHQHSRHYHPNSTVLYMHSKGTTAMSDNTKSFWRETMIGWNVGMHKYQRELLSKGWLTSGLLLKIAPWPHYSGNFFWSQSGFLAKKPSLRSLIWQWRYGAERWLLAEEENICRNYKGEWKLKYFPFPSLGAPIENIFTFDMINTTNHSFFC